MATRMNIPLRERKHARTKLALLQAALTRIEQDPLEDIAVKDLCDTAMVSEATFFNYFPRKADLLAYHSQLWSLELNWHGRAAAQQTPGLKAIEAVFRQAAQQVQARPGVIGELIAYQARVRGRPPAVELGRAERLEAFPNLADIDSLPAGGLEAVLVPNLQHAIERGELPANTHVHSVMVALISIFYGVPLTLARANPGAVSSMYLQQLLVLWAGVRAAASGTPR